MSDAAWTENPTDAPVMKSPQRGGFTLTFAGLASMLLGVGAFLWGQALEPVDMARYQWREVAGVALGIALPLFLLGVSHSLPGRTWTRALAYGGLALSGAGLVAFSWLYPYMWNVAGRDYSPYGIVPYGAGIVLLGASGFAGLIDAYLERRSVRVAETDDGRPVTEEEVMRDIDEQTRRQRLSWGGVMLTDGPAITLSVAAGASLDASDSVGRRYILENLETTPEVDRLLAFRGARRPAQEAMESQADALLRLREEQQARARPAGGGLRAWWSRVWARGGR